MGSGKRSPVLSGLVCWVVPSSDRWYMALILPHCVAGTLTSNFTTIVPASKDVDLATWQSRQLPAHLP
jgi:hypothetical protein